MVFPKVRITSSNNLCNPITTITFSSIHLMRLPAIVVGIIVLVMVAPLQGQPLIPGGNGRNFEYKRYCSNSLSDAMRLICGGRSNSFQTQYQDSNGTVNSSNLKHLSNDDGNLFRTVQTTGQLHECCRRPCGYTELKLYCSPD